MADKIFTPKEAAIAVLKKAEELYKSSTLAKGDWAKIHSKLKREGYSEESADKIDGAIKAKLGKGEHQPHPGLKSLVPAYGAAVQAESEKHLKSPQGDAERKVANAERLKLGKGELKKDGMMPAPSPTTAPMPTIDNKIGNPFGKSYEVQESKENPDAKEDAELGEKVEQDVEEHKEENPEAEAQEQEAPMKGHIKLAKFIGRMEHKKGQKSKELDKGETGHEKGINTSTDPSQKSRLMMGTSKAGSTLPAHANDPVEAAKDVAESKSKHKEVLNQIHQMSKPTLPG
jgi:hypothetical protein